MRILILGIGNTLLTDEGVGIHLLQYLQATQPILSDVTYCDGGTLSFTLAPTIEAHDALIVLDAAQLHAPAGTIKTFHGAEMDRFLNTHQRGVHEVGLMDLLSIATLQGHLPSYRALIGVQYETLAWGTAPSPEVAAALPIAAQQVVDLVHTWHRRTKL